VRVGVDVYGVGVGFGARREGHCDGLEVCYAMLVF
jgi:hypothetical protein